MIYLDNAASTKPSEEVIKVMTDTMRKSYGNPDAIHDFSHEIFLKIKNARKIVGNFLGVNPARIYFTAGGSDGNNLVIQGIVEANSRTKKHLITTKIEHPSVYETFKYYETKGFEVDFLDVDKDGFINTEQLKSLLRDDTSLVSIGAVNSEVGSVQDLKEISNIIKGKSREIYFHTDFVQGFGCTDIKFDKIPVDAITVSGHKICAPKGIGAVYVAENVKIANIVHGSNSENGIVKRTMPTELILGFAKAVELLDKNYRKDMEYLQNLKTEFAKKIEENIADVKINSIFDIQKSSPKVLNVSFKGTKGEVLTHFLGMNGIYVSTGSACSSKKGNSRILTVMGLKQDELDGAIRFSFSSENILEEIEKTVEVLKKSVEQIRKMR